MKAHHAIFVLCTLVLFPSAQGATGGDAIEPSSPNLAPDVIPGYGYKPQPKTPEVTATPDPLETENRRLRRDRSELREQLAAAEAALAQIRRDKANDEQMISIHYKTNQRQAGEITKLEKKLVAMNAAKEASNAKDAAIDAHFNSAKSYVGGALAFGAIALLILTALVVVVLSPKSGWAKHVAKALDRAGANESRNTSADTIERLLKELSGEHEKLAKTKLEKQRAVDEQREAALFWKSKVDSLQGTNSALEREVTFGRKYSVRRLRKALAALRANYMLRRAEQAACRRALEKLLDDKVRLEQLLDDKEAELQHYAEIEEVTKEQSCSRASRCPDDDPTPKVTTNAGLSEPSDA